MAANYSKTPATSKTGGDTKGKALRINQERGKVGGKRQDLRARESAAKEVLK